MTDKAWEDRQTKRIPLPPTDQELQDYQEWKDNYDEVHEQGFDRGWLDHGVEGEFFRGPKPSGHEERPETDEEYEKRMKSPFARAMWEMSRNVLRQLGESSTILNFLNTPQEPKPGETHAVFPVVKRGDL